MVRGNVSSEDEDQIVWQDTLDEIQAGRLQSLSCPICAEGKLEVTRRGQFTRVQCKKCQKFVEGQFGSFE